MGNESPQRTKVAGKAVRLADNVAGFSPSDNLLLYWHGVAAQQNA
jgi:hypothetical protein